MKLMKSGRLSLRHTPESQLLKLRKQKLRASRKKQDTTEKSSVDKSYALWSVLDLDFKTNANHFSFTCNTFQHST
eukprot:10907630-Karenia_brevis.AAC.1